MVLTGAPSERGSGFAAGVGLALTGSSAGPIGAAIGALALPVLGPIGLVGLRQIFATPLLLLLLRGGGIRIRRRDWLPIAILGIVLSGMSLSVYAAVERIGLGLTVTLEFLGPLVVLILSSPRWLDYLCGSIALTGVIVLTSPRAATDLIGIGFALLGALCWGLYIVANRIIGSRIPGLGGAVAANLFSMVLWIPITAIWLIYHPPTLWTITLTMICALFATTVYASDLLALRRIPASLYSALASLAPIWSTLAGLVILGERFAWNEWVGMVIIIVSNITLTIAHARRSDSGPPIPSNHPR